MSGPKKTCFLLLVIPCFVFLVLSRVVWHFVLASRWVELPHSNFNKCTDPEATVLKGSLLKVDKLSVLLNQRAPVYLSRTMVLDDISIGITKSQICELSYSGKRMPRLHDEKGGEHSLPY